MKKWCLEVITFLVICGCLCFISFNESNKKDPMTSYYDKQSVDGDESDNTEEIVDESIDNSVGTINDETKDFVITKTPLKYEILSIDCVGEKEVCTRSEYAPYNYYFNHYPDVNYMIEQVDYQAVMEESAELAEIWNQENNGKYTDDEIIEIYNRNKHIIDQNTKRIHPNTKYVFLKCKISNISNIPVEKSVGLDIILSSTDLSNYIYHDSWICYFDMSQHVEGDDRVHAFYLYKFGINETIECTLGFQIQMVENSSSINYYIGAIEDGMPEYVNPVKGKNVICITEDLLKDEE